MATQWFIYLMQDLVWTTVLLTAPIIGVSLLVGLLVSMLQTVFGLQEQTLSFAPRLMAVAATLLVGLPWFLSVSMAFTARMLQYMIETAQ